MESIEDSEIMLLGGASVGKRYIYWNFVSSSEKKIEQAKSDWLGGKVRLYVYNRENNKSEFVILDAKNFTAELLATIELPRRVPHGLHGS